MLRQILICLGRSLGQVTDKGPEAHVGAAYGLFRILQMLNSCLVCPCQRSPCSAPDYIHAARGLSRAAEATSSRRSRRSCGMATQQSF